MNKKSSSSDYQGFEQGPIRPPSEAYSLLIRVTRNCPWNRCTFCPVYKKAHFSPRPVEHVKKDIDTVHKYVNLLKDMADPSGHIGETDIIAAAKKSRAGGDGNIQAFQAAINWIVGGMQSIFIQDANSLVIKPQNMIEILSYLKKQFPDVRRITSYARSDTVARLKDQDLQAMANAGLNRIHIGLESGSDRVLEKVHKGVTKDIHIKGGLKVKAAGIELSEYVMPGLGGKELSGIHALETADALNRIDPHFIRLRTLAIPNRMELAQEYRAGSFERCTDLMTAREILLLIENLEGITGVIKSDHILNLFQEVEGKMPEDKEYMTGIIESFLAMDPQQQCLYQAGRRMMVFERLSDMEDPHKLAHVEQVCQRLGVTPDNIDATIEELTKRFV